MTDEETEFMNYLEQSDTYTGARIRLGNALDNLFEVVCHELKIDKLAEWLNSMLDAGGR